LDEAFRGEIGLEKSLGTAVGANQGFGGEVAAADGSFHGGRPAGLRPVTRQEQAGNRSCLSRAPAIYARFRRKSGGRFFDDGGLEQLRPAGFGQSMANFREAELDDFLSGFLE
jgi:hypothetical protein